MFVDEIVTIDGPTSSGKNSVGFLLAKKLGYQYFDTGMIYRAGCYKILQDNISIDNLDKVLGIYKNLDVKFETNDHWKMFLEGEDVTDKLHSPQISRLVPVVSAQPKVRETTRLLQRKLGEGGKIVMGGRDIGSEIFPDAKFKFWLIASVEERAKRRFNQLAKKDPSIKYEDVLADMQERDRQDSQREASPMRIPKDAYVLDNTKLNVEETVSEILKIIYGQT